MDGSREEVGRIGAPPRGRMHTVEAEEAIFVYQEAVSYELMKLQHPMLVISYSFQMHERMIACLKAVSRKHLMVN